MIARVIIKGVREYIIELEEKNSKANKVTRMIWTLKLHKGFQLEKTPENHNLFRCSI